MTFSELMWGIGDFFYDTFELLEQLENLPNVFFLVVGSILFLYWVLQLIKAKSKAAREGSLE